MFQPIVFKKVLPYILAYAVILGMGFWIYHTGYYSGADDITRKYEVKIQKERERIQSANRDALKNAKEREAEFNKILNERNNIIKLLVKEAENDVNANRPALGIDSVQRINRIR